MAAEAPTGTVTFLFTDIEGSTRLWEEHGDAMAVALARHDEIARAVFDELGGYVFATGGDGFAVAFGRAADALAAAEELQNGLGDESWDGAVIRVRVGLHTGEAEERGGDYFGPAVNRAARVMAAGHGGQILATDACAQVAESGALVELGEFRLRDLSGPQRVFQLGDGSFPRLRTIDAYPSNLPKGLSTFVGREEQIAELLDDLRANDLVTLTGTGGVGKTRLAVQVCAEALPKFSDGAWFVDLAAIRDPAQVVNAVAAVLSVNERPGEALAVTLRDYFRDREAVVLLDNGEHVVDALADLIVSLRSREIAAKFLVTSREPLGMAGEQVHRVVSLDPTESAELFVQRASKVRSHVDWNSYQADVVEICERLDGIPLAIELAAARSRSMLPADILARLDERFRLLKGGRSGDRERHQTLLAAVEWSYDLLDDDERALFERLAVFRGGFGLQAAEAIGSGGVLDELDVVDLLDRLVDKSMVLAFETGGRSRYRLLETLRQFGESRLMGSGSADEFRDRHYRYFEGFSRELGRLVPTTAQVDAAGEMATESANIEAALSWVADSDRWIDCWQLCLTLKPYWSSHASPAGMRWYELLVSHLDRFEPADQARILAEAAHTISAFDSVRGGELAQLSLELAQGEGRAPSPLAYQALSLSLQKDGDDETAVGFAVLADEASASDDHTAAVWFSLAFRTSAEVESRHPDGGAHADEFLAFTRELGMPLGVAAATCAAGRHASLSGDHESAEALFAEAIDLGRDSSPQVVIATVAFRAADRLRSGHERILEGVREALELFGDVPVAVDAVADIWAIIATIWLREGRVEDAAILGCTAGALLMSLGVSGRANHAHIRDQLGEDLAEALAPEELDTHIAAAQEMTADDVRRFIFERL